VDDADLQQRLLAALETLWRDGEQIAEGIGRTVVRNLKLMARMGVYFEEEVQRRYPEFPTRKGEWDWKDYLPPMSEGLHALIEKYADEPLRMRA
jgi:predicted DNA-binding ArsR family transcriptional regulator